MYGDTALKGVKDDPGAHEVHGDHCEFAVKTVNYRTSVANCGEKEGPPKALSDADKLSGSGASMGSHAKNDLVRVDPACDVVDDVHICSAPLSTERETRNEPIDCVREDLTKAPLKNMV